MSRVGIEQDHQIVSKTRVLDVGEPAAACHLLRPLEHPVHLSEVEVAEQRRDDPALRAARYTAPSLIMALPFHSSAGLVSSPTITLPSRCTRARATARA